jgi:hypothetical protein
MLTHRGLLRRTLLATIRIEPPPEGPKNRQERRLVFNFPNHWAQRPLKHPNQGTDITITSRLFRLLRNAFLRLQVITIGHRCSECEVKVTMDTPGALEPLGAPRASCLELQAALPTHVQTYVWRHSPIHADPGLRN